MGAILFPLRLMLALAVLFLPFRPLRAMALAASGVAGLTALGPSGAPVPPAQALAAPGEVLAHVQAAVADGDFAVAAALVAALPASDEGLARARPALVAAALLRVRPLPAADAMGNHAGYAFLAALDPATTAWADRAALYAARLP